jgi:hypothetical protein
VKTGAESRSAAPDVDHAKISGFVFSVNSGVPTMGNKIVTEADRKATPAPKPAGGFSARRAGNGQKVSLERGTWTRSKKNPGKRPHKGG